MIDSVKKGSFYFFPTYWGSGPSLTFCYTNSGMNDRRCLLVIWPIEAVGRDWVLDERMAAQGIEVEVSFDPSEMLAYTGT